MVALDGKFYQIGENGKTVEAKSEWKTPFAQVIFFHPTLVLEMRNIADYSQLKENVSAHFKNKNIPYVLRFEGYFDSLTLRSRTPHSVMKNKTSSNEAIYEASNIEGTLVGFWFPHYLLNIGIPGFHLHFIAKDRQFSGHVLDLKCAQTQFALQPAMTVNLIFPNTQEFATADISVPTLEKYKKIQM
jgi:acetolactate decarboxylase